MKMNGYTDIYIIKINTNIVFENQLWVLDIDYIIHLCFNKGD